MAFYFPLVRTKAGEADALGNLSVSAQGKVVPIVQVTTEVPDTFVNRVTAQMAGRTIALDGSYNHRVTGTTATFLALANSLSGAGLTVVPSIPFNPDPAYLAAVRQLAAHLNVGVVVHVPLAQLSNAEAWVTAQGWAPANVDLVVSVGGVSDYDPVTFSGYVAQSLSAVLNAGHLWHTVVLHAHSAPRDYSGLPVGRTLLPRIDWRVWQLVAAAVPFQLHYSDSGHLHPSLEEPPGVAMINATVSARYAIDDHWIIYKGVATSGPNGQPMGNQYRAHANALIAEPQFGGVAGCWGDDRIQYYAATLPPAGAGGRAQWAAVLLNRHLSLVADRLP